MTTTTVFGSTNDGALVSSNTVYATAAAGSGLSVATTSSTGDLGQIFSTPNYFIYQLFFEFDTTIVPDTDTVSDVVFSLDGNTDSSTQDFVATVLSYDWSSGGLTTADWRTPAQLAALTSLATFNTSGYSSSYMDFTSAGAAFYSHINKAGSTYFMVASDRNISATTPTTLERITVTLSNASGTSTDPKLVITHAPEFSWTALTPNNTTSTVASLALTGVTASVGSLVHIDVSAGNSGSAGIACTTTCADDSAEAGTANVWTQRTQANADPGAANAGITLTIFTSILTRALVSDSITVSFSPSAAGVAITGEIGAIGGPSSVVANGGAGTTGVDAAPTITSVSITAGDTIIGAVAAETNDAITGDADTTNGSWSTQIEATSDTGTDATSSKVASQRKKVTATGTQTYNPTIAASRDWAASYIVVRPSAPASVTADAGSYAVTGTAATPKRGRKAVADAGAYTVTGTAATPRKGLPLAASAGAYAVTGQAASFVQTRRAAADAGSYAVTGIAATLSIEAAGTEFTVTELVINSDFASVSNLLIDDVTASVGDLIVIEVSAGNSGTNGAACTTTVSDDGGNTYTQRTQVNRDPGAANEGITLTVFTTIVTSALASNSILVAFSPNATGAVVGGYVFAPGGGETASYITAGAGASGSSATPTITTGSITSGDTVVAAIAAETNDTITGDGDTSNGSWSTQYGGTVEDQGDDVSDTQLRSQYKTVTGTATQTYNPTIAGAQDYAINYIVIRSAGTGPSLAAATGSYVVTGTAASLESERRVTADAGTYAVSGTAASLEVGLEVTGEAGSYSISGQAAGFRYTYAVSAGAGSYAVSGQTATLAAGETRIDADPGSYVVTGSAASLEYGWKIAAAAGSYGVTGTAASLEFGREVAAAAGSYAVTGSAATLIASAKTVVAAAGSYAVTGQTVDLAIPPAGISVVAGVGSYLVSGQTVGLVRAYEVSAVGEVGVYAVTGTAATLTLEDVGAISVAAAAGSYTVTGQDASLERGDEAVAGAGSYAVTGQDVSLERGDEATAGAGSYVVSGQTASLERGDEAVAGAGSYAVVGSDVSLQASAARTLQAESGSYSITGTDADLNVVEIETFVGTDFHGRARARLRARRKQEEEDLRRAEELARRLAKDLRKAERKPPPSVAPLVARSLRLTEILDRTQAIEAAIHASRITEQVREREFAEAALKAQRVADELQDEEDTLFLLFHAA